MSTPNEMTVKQMAEELADGMFRQAQDMSYVTNDGARVAANVDDVLRASFTDCLTAFAQSVAEMATREARQQLDEQVALTIKKSTELHREIESLQSERTALEKRVREIDENWLPAHDALCRRAEEMDTELTSLRAENERLREQIADWESGDETNRDIIKLRTDLARKEQALRACIAPCYCGGTLTNTHNDDCPVELRRKALAKLTQEDADAQ